MITDQMRYQGCMMGLAAGDALGTTVEFKSPGSFSPLTDIVGGGPFRLEPGQWTDDTSMALCLLEGSSQALSKVFPGRTFFRQGIDQTGGPGRGTIWLKRFSKSQREVQI